MDSRKRAAAVILAVAGPAYVGAIADPHEDRLAALWLKGAGVLGMAITFAWAVHQLGDGSSS